MGCMERVWRRVGVLCFSRFLSDGEKAEGAARLKPSPGRGRGTTKWGMRLTFFYIDVVPRKKNLHFAARDPLDEVDLPSPLSGAAPCKERGAHLLGEAAKVWFSVCRKPKAEAPRGFRTPSATAPSPPCCGRSCILWEDQPGRRVFRRFSTKKSI